MTIATLEMKAEEAMSYGDYTLCERLCDELDRIEASRRPTLLQSALWYASVGLPVFRLQVGGKKPLPKTRGCLDATIDAEQVRAWWGEGVAYNVGIATGHLVDAIDVDGPEGAWTWSDPQMLRPPILGIVSTPRAAGRHYYIAPTGERNGVKMWPGIDYRGAGGYVVAPPSVIDSAHAAADECTAGPYRWVRGIEL